MKFSQVQLAALVASLASAQTLNIPTRVGDITSLPEASTISGSEDHGNKEFDRGHACDTDTENESSAAVFILEDGASLSNVIIGADALEGVHCLGSCTLTNVWFRDVCEDAISVLGTGDATIVGGGAQNAFDKVVQHNGAGTVTIKDFTVINAGKLYRSCGDCTDNESKSPRKVIIENVRAYGMEADLVGINSNFGDEATISGSCGETKMVCQEYKGYNKGDGKSSQVDTKTSCLGEQGLLEKLPACGADDELPEVEDPPESSSEAVPSPTPTESADEDVPSPTSTGEDVPSPTSTESEDAPLETMPTSTEDESAPEETDVEQQEDEQEEGKPTTSNGAAPSTLVTRTKTEDESAPTGGYATGSVARWGRCGGKGYTGPTECAVGECKVQNGYYSQCV